MYGVEVKHDCFDAETNVKVSTKGYLTYKTVQPEQKLLESYNDLVADKYALQSNRYRRFSQYKARFLISQWVLEKLPHRPFVQSSRYNSHSGGVLREFAPIKYDFSRQIDEALKLLSLDAKQEFQLDIHQYRICADSNNKGDPVPEGPHQDGHEIVGIIVFRRHLIKGAENSLYRLDGTKFLSLTLSENEAILLDDGVMKHDATKIEATTDQSGFRDYLVFNINRWQNRRYGEEFEKQSV